MSLPLSKRRKIWHPEVYEILALTQFHVFTSTYGSLCPTQTEDARGTDSEPVPEDAAYGLKTLYDCGTAEVEYAMT